MSDAATTALIADNSLQATGITKAGRLHNVDFALVPGTLTAIVGPNGAGKTTLLNTLSDNCSVDDGHVILNGKPLAQWRPRLRAQQLALLPQYSVLTFPFAAADVVAMGRYPHGTTHLHNIEIIHTVIRTLDCQQVARRIYPKLSIGEKQRIQLARVLCQIWEPAPFPYRYLLLDEPTAGLDLAHQHVLFDCLQQLKTTGVGIAVVLHDLNMALQYADEVALLDNGELITHGPTRDVISAPNIEHYFNVHALITNEPQTGVAALITKAKGSDQVNG